MRFASLFAVVALLGLTACSPSQAEPKPDDGPRCEPSLAAPSAAPALEVLRETSTQEFVPVADDDMLTRHWGNQGGTHFWIYPRVFTESGEIWFIDAKLVGADGTTLAAGGQGFTACALQWTKPRQVTVFLEASGDLAGTLTVSAKPQQGAPLTFEAPIKVGSL
ncbi:MAG: hypothetical protein IPI67_21565 [Myxococcales bacterium]|nr:hypothetical protein [Myxococcales bacterium]